MTGNRPQDYERRIEQLNGEQGKTCAYFASNVADAPGFGAFAQWIRADEYRGKRLRMAASVKSEEIEFPARGSLCSHVHATLSRERRRVSGNVFVFATSVFPAWMGGLMEYTPGGILRSHHPKMIYEGYQDGCQSFDSVAAHL